MKKHKNDCEPYVGSDGRQKVFLYDKNGVGKEMDLALIVASTFPEMVSGVPVNGKLPQFKDGNPANCAVFNLYWEE